MDELIRKGQEIYKQDLKALLEPNYNGQAVAIHVPTGDYAVASSHPKARKVLRERHEPDGMVVTLTIGPPTLEDQEMAQRYLLGSKS